MCFWNVFWVLVREMCYCVYRHLTVHLFTTGVSLKNQVYIGDLLQTLQGFMNSCLAESIVRY